MPADGPGPYLPGMSLVRTPAESPLYGGPAATLGRVVPAITIRRFSAGTLDATGATPDAVHDPPADTVAR